jgi:hypothetical protein
VSCDKIKKYRFIDRDAQERYSASDPIASYQDYNKTGKPGQ